MSLLDNVRKITNLPTLPAVLRQLRRAIEDPEVNARQVAVILSADPAMMSRILKVANSAYYCAQPQQIDSLEQAVARLGLRAVSNLAMSTAIFSTFPVNNQQVLFSRRDFWHHCIGTGIAAALLRTALPIGTRNTLPDNDVLHLAGLLHDLGIIILEQYFHKQFQAALTLARTDNLPLHVAERSLLGCDHAEVGAWLGEQWKLADNLVAAVRWHHEPATATAAQHPLVYAVHWANWLCQESNIGYGGGGAAAVLHAEVAQAMPVPEECRRQLAEDVRQQAAATVVLLGLGD